MFCRDDFAALSELLSDIDGRFLLSVNDVPEIRDIFAAFDINQVSTLYTAAPGKNKTVGELLIRNY